MMRRSISLFLFLFLASKSFAGENNLVNPGFENGFNGWINSGNVGLRTENHSGLYSSYHSIVGSNLGYWSNQYQDVYYNTNKDNYPANCPIYVSGFIKTRIHPMTKSNAGLMVQFIDSQDKILNQNVVKVGGVTDWREVSLNSNAPTGTKKVRVMDYTWADSNESIFGGESWFDDLVCSRTPITLNLHNDLFNPDFENGVNDWVEQFQPTTVSTVAHKGMLGLTYKLLTSNYFAVLNQTIDITPNQKFKFKAWVGNYVQNTGTIVGICARFLDSNNKQIGQIEGASLPAKIDYWRELSFDAQAPGNAVKVELGYFVYATNGSLTDQVFLDDVSLVKY